MLHVYIDGISILLGEYVYANILQKSRKRTENRLE